MSLVSCPKCWENPCICGEQYRGWSEDMIVDFINNMLKFHNKEVVLKRLNPEVVTQVSNSDTAL